MRKTIFAVLTAGFMLATVFGTCFTINASGNGGGAPDLALTALNAYYSEELKQLSFRYRVENIGETYVDPNGEEIEFIVEFYVDESTTPSDSLILPRIWWSFEDPTVLRQGWSEGWGWVLELDEKPTTLTMKVDTNNDIPESDEESNNEMTVEVFLDVSISGTVYKKENGILIPATDMTVVARPWLENRFARADENGEYSITIKPKEPFDEPHTYTIFACKDYYEQPYLEKISEPLMIGESTTLDFIITLPPTKPAKPSGDQIIRINTEHTYSTSTTDPDGDQICYKFYWGDGANSEWLGPYDSGETVSASHNWNEPGVYEITVMARDAEGLMGELSDPLRVRVQKYKVNNLFTEFLQKIVERVPMIETIYEQIIERVTEKQQDVKFENPENTIIPIEPIYPIEFWPGNPVNDNTEDPSNINEDDPTPIEPSEPEQPVNNEPQETEEIIDPMEEETEEITPEQANIEANGPYHAYADNSYKVTFHCTDVVGGTWRWDYDNDGSWDTYYKTIPSDHKKIHYYSEYLDDDSSDSTSNNLITTQGASDQDICQIIYAKVQIKNGILNTYTDTARVYIYT